MSDAHGHAIVAPKKELYMLGLSLTDQEAASVDTVVSKLSRMIQCDA